VTVEGRTLVDMLIEQKERNQKYFLRYRDYARTIKRTVGKYGLDDARVLVFGSVVKGKWIPNKSDIDILIISKKVSNSASWQTDLKVKALEEIGDLGAPFEIHFASPRVYSEWFQKFIKNDYEEV
jgi:predicted nucleotidyltransferase